MISHTFSLSAACVRQYPFSLLLLLLKVNQGHLAKLLCFLCWLFMPTRSKHDLKVLKASSQVIVWRAALEIWAELLNQMSQCKKSVEALLCGTLFQRQICLDLCYRFSNFLTRENWFCYIIVLSHVSVGLTRENGSML